MLFFLIFKVRMNLFFDLPPELQRYIYEFDNTYHVHFRRLMTSLHPHRVFSIPQGYMIFHTLKKMSYTVDSFERPTSICIRNTVDVQHLEDWLEWYDDIVELDPVELHYPLELSDLEYLLMHRDP